VTYRHSARRTSARCGSPDVTATSAPDDLALRWMLGEAANVNAPVLLGDEGESLLRTADSPDPPEIHQSWTLPWRALEQIPRREIDNSCAYPMRVSHRGSEGTREPELPRRQGSVVVHASVGDRHSIQGRVDVCKTKGPPTLRC
jgi:hypothetical protein